AALLADTSVRGHRFCDAYTSLADAWLTELLGDEPDVALVAVGSYGRRELCPGSDLDVVLLHRGRRDIGALADRLWHPIWHANVPLDPSVRTGKEVVAVTSRDLKAVLGFSSARCVAGDADLVTSLVQRIDVTWQTAGRRRLADLDAMVQERHARSGEVAFLLEPDLKEGRGGLRDLVALTAARRVTPFEVESESALSSSGTVLLDARVELQRATGRATDRLTLQEQDVVAAALGMDADTLMAGVAAAGRAIAVEAD